MSQGVGEQVMMNTRILILIILFTSLIHKNLNASTSQSSQNIETQSRLIQIGDSLRNINYDLTLSWLRDRISLAKEMSDFEELDYLMRFAIETSLEANQVKDAENFLIEKISLYRLAEFPNNAQQNSFYKSAILFQKNRVHDAYNTMLKVITDANFEENYLLNEFNLIYIATFFTALNHEKIAGLSLEKINNIPHLSQRMKLRGALVEIELLYKLGRFREAKYELNELEISMNIHDFKTLLPSYYQLHSLVSLALNHSLDARKFMLLFKRLMTEVGSSRTPAISMFIHFDLWQETSLDSLYSKSDYLVYRLNNYEFLNYFNFYFDLDSIQFEVKEPNAIEVLSSLNTIAIQNADLLEKKTNIIFMLQTGDEELFLEYLSEESIIKYDLYVIATLILFFLLLILWYLYRSFQLKKKNQIDSNYVIPQIIHENQVVELNRVSINKHLEKPLNDTNWNILQCLAKNPFMKNSEIAIEVGRSIEGVSSSLRKMYLLFDIHVKGNKKLALLEQAIQWSEPSLFTDDSLND